MRAMSPAGRTASPRHVGYTGSPIKDRVHLFENAMRDSAGLQKKDLAQQEEETSKTRKTKENIDVLRKSSAGRIGKPKRKSSLSTNLRKASAARKISIIEVLQVNDYHN